MTVAISHPSPNTTSLDDKDLDERFKRSTGPGGQHRNKSECCVVLTHRPTGITVTVDSRSQANNRKSAREELIRRLAALDSATATRSAAAAKRQQVGLGARGDKIRTYSVQHGLVTDHRTGKKAPLSSILDGKLDLLR